MAWLDLHEGVVDIFGELNDAVNERVNAELERRAQRERTAAADRQDLFKFRHPHYRRPSRPRAAPRRPLALGPFVVVLEGPNGSTSAPTDHLDIALRVARGAAAFHRATVRIESGDRTIARVIDGADVLIPKRRAR